MSKLLIQIEPYVPEGSFYQVGEMEREAQAHVTQKTLEIAGETPAERKQREKAEAELARLEQVRQDKIGAVNQLNHLWDQYQRVEANEGRAKFHVQAAQQTPADVAATIEQWFFEGQHPQLGRDAPTHLIINLACRVAGASEIIKAYPEWSKKNAAELASIKSKMIELADKIGMRAHLPEAWQEGN